MAEQALHPLPHALGHCWSSESCSSSMSQQRSGTWLPWQQLGTKSLNRPSSHCGHPGLGCPARSPPARQSGAPSAKTGGRRQSHRFSCGTSHFKELIHDFKLLLLVPLCPATEEGGQEPLCRPALLAKPPVKLQPQEFSLNAWQVLMGIRIPEYLQIKY